MGGSGMAAMLRTTMAALLHGGIVPVIIKL